MHLANGTRHLSSRHKPMALPSAACAEGTVIDSVKGTSMAENESVMATRAEIATFPTRSKVDSEISWLMFLLVLVNDDAL
mmetsp:Transcript_10227/g.11407  ORF Transcript_10227/g.11407 Transcript_10227/m.11407 type:complete len:80 (+) Transcript_10227:1247-1486(+)